MKKGIFLLMCSLMVTLAFSLEAVAKKECEKIETPDGTFYLDPMCAKKEERNISTVKPPVSKEELKTFEKSQSRTLKTLESKVVPEKSMVCYESHSQVLSAPSDLAEDHPELSKYTGVCGGKTTLSRATSTYSYVVNQIHRMLNKDKMECEVKIEVTASVQGKQKVIASEKKIISPKKLQFVQTLPELKEESGKPVRVQMTFKTIPCDARSQAQRSAHH